MVLHCYKSSQVTLAVITQVEYAQEAVKKGSTAVGVSLSLPPRLELVLPLFEARCEQRFNGNIGSNPGENCKTNGEKKIQVRGASCVVLGVEKKAVAKLQEDRYLSCICRHYRLISILSTNC